MIVTTPPAKDHQPLPDVPILDVVGTDTPLRRKTAREYDGPCPFCGDGDDRFVVFLDNNRWLCRVCSPRGGDAAAYLMQRDSLTFPEAADRIREMAGEIVPSRTQPGKLARLPDAATVAYHTYLDADGNPIRRKIRRGTGKGKAISWEYPHSSKPDTWLSGGGEAPATLYNRDRLAAQPAALVLILEGEKCCDCATAVGLLATCNPHGAGEWRQEYSESLRGRHVVISPDCDAPGRKHGNAVAAGLSETAASVRILDIDPAREDGYDLADWLQEHTREELDALIVGAPTWVPGDDSADWPEPVAFDTFTPPPFPVTVLPAWLREYVEALAEQTQTPPDLAGMLVLSVLALCVARRARIGIREGWGEPLCLWSLVTLRSGSRKSAVYKAATAPARAYEQEISAESRVEIDAAKARKRIADARQKAAEAAATKADAEPEAEDRAIALAKELAGMEVPAPPILMEGDITPEALIVSLAEQGGSLAVMAPEGGLLTTITGSRYSDATNIDALLCAHSGDAIRTNRVGRGPLYVPDPALTMALTVQPPTLNGLAANAEFSGRGLLARFLYSLPPDLLGSRDVNPPAMDPAIAARYDRGVRALLDLAPIRDEQGKEHRHTLTPSPEAHAALTAFMAWIEPQLAEFGALAGEDGWANKLAGTAARIAALLHMADHEQPGHAIHMQVCEGPMRRAITLATDYLIPHARAALRQMGADAATEQARHILAWIERGGRATFTRRDVCKDLTARFTKPEDADPPLSLLVDSGHIRPHQPEPGKKGRKPDAAFDVNPRTLSRNRRNGQNTPPGSGRGGDSAYSVHFATAGEPRMRGSV